MTPTAEFLAHWEGLHRVEGGLVYPYSDIVGVPTVGYGFTDPAIVGTAPHPIALMQIMLEREAARHELMATRLSPVLLRDDRRLTAIASFIFNLGAGAYQRSTLKRRVDAQDWRRARTEIQRWVYAGGKPVRGLRRRRAAEAALL